MFLGQPQNECQINDPHPYVNQTWKFGEDRSSIFWDIWREKPISAYHSESCNLSPCNVQGY